MSKSTVNNIATRTKLHDVWQVGRSTLEVKMDDPHKSDKMLMELEIREGCLGKRISHVLPGIKVTEVRFAR